MTAPVTDPRRRTALLGWVVVAVLAALVEGYALGGRTTATLSSVVREQLETGLGRALLVPFWTWLSWHWFLAPTMRPTWRDLVAIGVGLVLAAALPLCRTRLT